MKPKINQRLKELFFTDGLSGTRARTEITIKEVLASYNRYRKVINPTPSHMDEIELIKQLRARGFFVTTGSDSRLVVRNLTILEPEDGWDAELFEFMEAASRPLE